MLYFVLAYVQGVYGDNGSLMYHHGYGYAPYGPYSPAGSPVPTLGNDGQLYGPQHYQYPFFQPLTPTNGPFTHSPAASQTDVSVSVAADQKPLPVDATNGNSNGVTNGGSVKGNNASAPLKPNYQNSFVSNGSYGTGALPGRGPASNYQDGRYNFDMTRSPFQWLDGPLLSDGQSRPVTSTAISNSISNGNNLPSSRNQNFRPNTNYMVCMVDT